MKRTLLLCLALLFVGTVASAQCHEDPDEICIFFSQDCYACDNCLSYVGGAAVAYVVLMNCSEPSGVLGFEFCLCNEDGSPFAPPVGSSIFTTGYIYPPNTIGTGNPPCFLVGMAMPLPWSPCMTLIGINLLILSPETWCFGVMPFWAPSIPGHMVYAAGDDVGNLKPMYPCTGSEENSCFMACINSPDCPPPIPVGNAAWGSVKAMYR
jgi:hypothetical protein